MDTRTQRGGQRRARREMGENRQKHTPTQDLICKVKSTGKPEILFPKEKNENNCKKTAQSVHTTGVRKSLFQLFSVFVLFLHL
jgi:hypothetical protein